MDEIIKSKLALEIAQSSLDKATLQAQVEQLRQQNEEIQSQIESKKEVMNNESMERCRKIPNLH